MPTMATGLPAPPARRGAAGEVQLGGPPVAGYSRASSLSPVEPPVYEIGTSRRGGDSSVRPRDGASPASGSTYLEASDRRRWEGDMPSAPTRAALHFQLLRMTRGRRSAGGALIGGARRSRRRGWSNTGSWAAAGRSPPADGCADSIAVRSRSGVRKPVASIRRGRWPSTAPPRCGQVEEEAISLLFPQPVSRASARLPTP